MSCSSSETNDYCGVPLPPDEQIVLDMLKDCCVGGEEEVERAKKEGAMLYIAKKFLRAHILGNNDEEYTQEREMSWWDLYTALLEECGQWACNKFVATCGIAAWPEHAGLSPEELFGIISQFTDYAEQGWQKNTDADNLINTLQDTP